MGFNSAFKGLKLLKNPGNGRLNNLNNLNNFNGPDRPQCVKPELTETRYKVVGIWPFGSEQFSISSPIQCHKIKLKNVYFYPWSFVGVKLGAFP